MRHSHDYENRLIKVIKEEPGETVTVTFRYDPFGRRVEKKVETTEDGKTETRTYAYVYDNEDIILEYLTKDGGKEEVTRYVHGPGIDEPLAIERGGEVYFYHADGLGSITALTDAKEKVVESYTYSSFGELKRKSAKVKNAYTYTAREWDEEIELYFYRARYYDPEAGRFVSFDPILRAIQHTNKTCKVMADSFHSKTPQELNPFVYVINNPVILTDNFGLYAYDGTATYTSGGEGVGGGFMEVTLSSNCHDSSDHTRHIGEYSVIFVGATLGAPVGRASFSFVMEDRRNSGGPKLERMTGLSAILSGTGAIGVGPSIGVLNMGEGFADITGFLAGVDFSADAFFGYSFLKKEKEECCH